MKRRIFSLLIALCLIVGLLPAITAHNAHAETITGTVTLFGTAVTIDNDDTTADVPAALYWANGGEGAAPVASTADADWNYSFTLVDGIPTVTIKNAEYTYTSTFLYAKYDGKLKLKYEGTNNIAVPMNKTKNTYRYFVYYGAATNSAGKGHLYIEGASNAVLNVTGGDDNSAMVSLGNKAYLTITGGTFNLEKTNAGGVYSLISVTYGKTVIENCTLNVKHIDSVSGKHPLVVIGNGKSYGLTIKNSDVTLENNGHIALCMGVFQSNMKGVLYSAAMTIEGDSTLRVINDSNSSAYDYSGIGIWALSITIKGGTLEAEGNAKAIHMTSTDTPLNLSSYDGDYDMYIAKDGDQVTEYATSTYFKVEPACTHKNTTSKDDVIRPASCNGTGVKNVTVTCDDCGETVSTSSGVLIPAAGHTEETVPGYGATCTAPGLTDGKKCKVCGETIKAQEPISATGHTEEAVPGYGATCTEPGLTDGKKCKVCGETLLAQEPIPAKHTLTAHSANAPQVGVAGNTAYWECTVCGKYFSDAEGTEEIEKDSWILDPLPEFTCDHENTQKTITETVTTPATCGDPGAKTVTVTCECSYIISVTENVEIPATGDHDEETVPGYGANCTETGLTDGVKCTVCKQTLLKQEVIPANGHNYDANGYCVAGCGDRRPVITTDGGKFRVAMNNLTYIRSYIFYLESADDIDISNWTQVKAAAQQIVGSPYGADDWKTYVKLTNLNMSTLPEEAGVYVLFVTYTDVNGKTVQTSEAIEVLPAVKPEIVTGTNNFTVEMNGLAYSKGYVFYLESADGVDLSNWNAVKKAAMQIAGSPYSATGDWKTYTNLEKLNNASLPDEAGVYVLFVTYQDANGDTRQISAAIEVVAASKPEITVSANAFGVEMNGLTYSRGYVFYLESADGVDLSDWSAVKKAAMKIAGSPYSTTGDWKTYTKPEALNKSTLPGEAGVYVLFVTYTDANGAVRQISAAIEIEAADTPEIVVGSDGFTVEMNGLEYSRGYIFYLESAEGVNTADWNSVMKAAKKITGSPYGISSDWKTYTDLEKLNKAGLPDEAGVYVLFVTYQDANGATLQISAAIEK